MGLINFMNSIKQFFLKLTLSLLLISLAGCQQDQARHDSSNNTVTVAILMPISGDNARLYKELVTMAKMGLVDSAQTRFRVISYDCSTKELMQQSMDKIMEQKTNIIIGPVFSEATEEVAARIKHSNMVAITLSNNPAVADKNILVFGHAPMRQTQYLLTELLANNYTNFVTMLPAGRHSQAVSAIFKEMINEKGATLARVEYYDDNDEDIAKVTKIISDSVDNLNENDFNLTKPAILLADDPSTLAKIFTEFSSYNLDSKAIIAGDSRININSKVGIVFTGSDSLINSEIPEKAAHLGVEYLSFLHMLAYDAGKLVGSAVGTSYNFEELNNNLKTNEFQGLSGKVRFVDSIAVREYDVLQKNNGVIGSLHKNETVEQ